MTKKSYLIIIIIIVIILILGFCIYSDLFNQKIKVGTTNFNMPNGYHEGALNEFGAINITNGTNSIFLFENNDDDIIKYVNSYEEHINDLNQTMDIINFTIDNIQIFKTNNKDNPTTVHYWFVKNNKTYDIYTWEGNEEIDSIILDIIKS